MRINKSILLLVLFLLFQVIPQSSVAMIGLGPNDCDCLPTYADDSTSQYNWEIPWAEGKIVNMKITNCTEEVRCTGWGALGTTIWFKLRVTNVIDIGNNPYEAFRIFDKDFWAVVIFNESGKYLCYYSECTSSFGYRVGDKFSGPVWGIYSEWQGEMLTGITIDKKSDNNHFREIHPSKSHPVSSWTAISHSYRNIGIICVLLAVPIISLFIHRRSKISHPLWIFKRKN